MTKSKATKFTTAAIAAIQSPSIRAWASSPHNLPIITEMAAQALSKNPKAKPQDFATYLTLTAMG
jgi:hypothetical protein